MTADGETGVRRINNFLCDLDIGGLSGALYNLSPEVGAEKEWSALRLLAQDVNDLGRSAVGELLLQVATLLESQAAPGPTTWGACIEPIQDRLAELEVPLMHEAEELWDAIESPTLGSFSSSEAQ